MKILIRRFEREYVALAVAGHATAVAKVACIPPQQDVLAHEKAIRPFDAKVLYEVEVGGGIELVPVDWRRFAHRRDWIRGALLAYVLDNARIATFDPITEQSRGALEQSLSVALRDLTTVVEVVAIGVEPIDERWGIEIDYTTIDGAKHRLDLPV